MMLNDFIDNETDNFCGKCGINASDFGQSLKAVNLCCLTNGVRGWESVFGLESPNSFRVIEPFTESVDENRVKAVD